MEWTLELTSMEEWRKDVGSIVHSSEMNIMKWEVPLASLGEGTWEESKLKQVT